MTPFVLQQNPSPDVGQHALQLTNLDADEMLNVEDVAEDCAAGFPRPANADSDVGSCVQSGKCLCLLLPSLDCAPQVITSTKLLVSFACASLDSSLYRSCISIHQNLIQANLLAILGAVV